MWGPKIDRVNFRNDLIRIGDIIVLRCSVGRTDPAAIMSWEINHGSPITADIKRQQTFNKSSYLYGAENYVFQVSLQKKSAIWFL